jgi:hypothetical protein
VNNLLLKHFEAKHVLMIGRNGAMPKIPSKKCWMAKMLWAGNQ